MVFRRIPLIEETALPHRLAKRPGFMIFWSITIAVTAIACAALLYAALGRAVNAAMPAGGDSDRHFRALLAGIDADLASGKLGPAEAEAARGELAREVLRSRADASPRPRQDLPKSAFAAGVAGIAALSFGLYTVLGSPDLPSQPLATRPELAAQSLDMDTAIARIEAALAENPDDLRGWSVVGPAYMSLGRFADAENAFRNVLALGGADAGVQTQLATSLLAQGEESGVAEAQQLLRSAVAADATAPLPRLYLAAELMRIKAYAEAAGYWQQAIDLAQGDEPWLAAAQQGLAAANNDGVDPAAAEQQEMIAGMVSGLAERLASEGGSIEEWTRLVRSYLVLGDTDKAQAAFDAAVTAYPAAFDRGDLDTLALGAGLKLNGAEP